MADFDIFNGDADGICALHQLRLSEPRSAELVTGVKRDIALLQRVAARVGPGDRLTVLDVSIEPNAAALAKVLAADARVQWIDHHNPGEIPKDDRLTCMVDTSPHVCTSILVDRCFDGRYRLWAVVAAFGDGLSASAHGLAYQIRIPKEIVERLATLGEALNYNAYGESIDDLFIHPADLYKRIAAYEDPLEFMRSDGVIGELMGGLLADMGRVQSISPAVANCYQRAYILPDTAWARRVSGHFANHQASAHPEAAIAVLTPVRSGNYMVSVRAPRSNPVGADKLCRQFLTGGGRQAAAGINSLAPDGIGAFIRLFQEHFPTPAAAEADAR